MAADRKYILTERGDTLSLIASFVSGPIYLITPNMSTWCLDLFLGGAKI